MAAPAVSNMDSAENSGSEVMEVSEEMYMDKGQFLQDIHMQFLKCVDDPAALMDEFRSQGAITSDEEGQIMAKTTRRDKVRRLWSFLKSDHVSSETFFKQCYPAIKARYPHILEGKKFAWDPGEEATVPCVRHAIMKRIPLKRFADLFPSAHGCSDEEYRLMTECPAEDQGWTLAFTLCAKLPQKERSGLFGANLRQELESKGISVADDTELQSMMQDSFLCQCPVKIPEPDVKRPLALKTEERCGERNHKRHADVNVEIAGSSKRPRQVPCHESSSDYPASTVDSEEQFSTSLSSQETAAAVVAETAGELEFSSREDKESLFEDMKKLNEATSAASKIRPLYRELEGIKEEINILMADDKCEGKQNTDDIIKISHLRRKGKWMFSLLRKNFNNASTVKKSADVEQRSVILKRQQMLKNEILEAEPFYQKAQAIHMEIQNQNPVAQNKKRKYPAANANLSIRYNPQLNAQSTAWFASPCQDLMGLELRSEDVKFVPLGPKRYVLL